MNSLEILLCIPLVIFSAYLSASEIALFTLSRFQVKSVKDEFRSTHRTLKKLLADPSGLLITILILNEMINIALSSLITEAVSSAEIVPEVYLKSIPRWGINSILGILITAPIVLIFCEITPKVIAARLNRYIVVLTVGPMNFLYEAFRPIRWMVHRILILFSGSFRKSNHGGVGHQDNSPILKESDFLLLVEEGHKEGAIGQSEFELIKNVFELDDTPVSEITTPLSQVLCLTVNTPVKDALTTFRERRYSRIPILSGSRNEIVGILYSKDLLRTKLNPGSSTQTVADFMRRPFFVRPNLRLNVLFRKFKHQKIHMAVVKDNQDEVIGVVTMSDLLDAVFEDLFSTDSFRQDSRESNYGYRHLIREATKSRN
jgi:putative hemolysin